jgi:hypothetical protein
MSVGVYTGCEINLFDMYELSIFITASQGTFLLGPG